MLFRPERGQAFAPHRNRVEKNRIVDSGPNDGIGIDVQGETESNTLAENRLRETRKPQSTRSRAEGDSRSAANKM